MEQHIGNSTLHGSQGVIGNVSGSVNFYGAVEQPEVQAHRTCCNAIFLTDPMIDRDSIVCAKGDRTDGTCVWIRENDRPKSWLEGETKLLCIRGGPGKGKTMMAVYLTQELDLENDRSVAYYFCSHQDAKRNSATSVLRGLLWQVLTRHPHLTQHIASSFDPPERGQAVLSSAETLWKLLISLACQVASGRIQFIVDGMDECDEESHSWLASKFVSVEGLQKDVGLSMMILSHDITGLEGCNCIILDQNHQRQVDKDVELFVQSQVQTLSQRLNFHPDFQDHVVSTLMEKSERTFLWVGYVMIELGKKKTQSLLEKAIHQLPKGLPALYARMLQSIEPESRNNCCVLLTWVAMSLRPQSIEVLGELLDYQPREAVHRRQAILDEIALCSPMITHQYHRIGFVYQSAKEYLLRREVDSDPVLEEFRIKPESAHLSIARRCLQALQDHTKLQYYAWVNWLAHARSLTTLAESLIRDEPGFFGEKSPARATWWYKYSFYFKDLPRVMPPRLHIAIHLGFEHWARMILLEEDPQSTGDLLDQRCPSGWTPLEYAAQLGNIGMIEFLLRMDPPATLSHESLQSSLRRTVLSGQVAALPRLLEHGVDPNKLDAKGMSPLHHATLLKNNAIMLPLLEFGADPNAKSSEGRRPIHYACSTKDADIVKILLDKGANVNGTDNLGNTSLHLFPRFYHIYKLLLSKGADLNARNRKGDAPSQVRVLGDPTGSMAPLYNYISNFNIPRPPLQEDAEPFAGIRSAFDAPYIQSRILSPRGCTCIDPSSCPHANLRPPPAQSLPQNAVSPYPF